MAIARASVSTAAAVVVSVGALLVGQAPPPLFRARTIVTELEVHVTDVTGGAVGDLSREDIEVLEDGVPQVILEVERLTTKAPDLPVTAAGTRATPASAAPQIVHASNATDGATRVWALVVDDLRVPGSLRDRMQACLRALVDGMPADDLVALVPTSGDRRASREFTRDRQGIRRAIDALRFAREFDGVRSVATMGADLVGPSAVGPERLDLISADNRLISTVGNAARMLGRAGAARPTVVLLSQGIPVGLSDEYRRSIAAQGAWTLLRRYDEWREVLERVQRSGVTMHVIDPTGFDEGMARRVSAADRLAGPTARMREFMATDDRRAAVRIIADRSGGLTLVDPDPAGAARRLLSATSSSYIVRYLPTRDEIDDRLRAVEVRVRRADVGVRTRSAYARVSDPEFEALRAGKPLGVAVAGVVPSADLRLSATADRRAAGTRTAVHVTLTVHGARGIELPARDVVEVLAIAVSSSGKTVAKAGGRFGVERRSGALPTEPLVLQPLKPGRYQVRLAARSVTLDRTGSVFLDLVVP